MNQVPDSVRNVLIRIDEIRRKVDGNYSAYARGAFERAVRESVETPFRSSLGDLVVKVSKEEGVDPRLVEAIIMKESGGNAAAVSKKGASGLMQLMPATAKSLGVNDVFDPIENIRGGVKYIKELLNKYDGDESLALAAYNAGPAAVKKYGGVPRYPETRDYVDTILASLRGWSK